MIPTTPTSCIVIFLDHYRKSEYEEALAQSKRINAFALAFVSAAFASAAGQLARRNEALAAIKNLERDHPGRRSAEEVRSMWSLWLHDDELIDRLLEGFEKALALVKGWRRES